MTDRFNYLRQRLDQVAARPVLRRPLERVRDSEQKIDDLAARLQRAAGRRIERANQKASAVAERLESLSPLNVLKRGYSLTLANGQIVREAETLSPGDTIETRLAAGSVTSRVVATKAS